MRIAGQEKGCPGQRVVDGQTLGERKQHMEQEENLGVKIIGLREPKLEKEVEQKAFKKGTGEGQLQSGWSCSSPCKYTELIAFPHHLCGHKHML